MTPLPVTCHKDIIDVDAASTCGTSFSPLLSFLCMSHLSDFGSGTERRFQQLLLLLVQLGEPLRPQRGACQSLAEDGIHWGGLEPAGDMWEVWKKQDGIIIYWISK